MLEKNHIYNISIDFVAGSHGNFLEYACNKFIAKIPANFDPFTSLGTSHNKPDEYSKQRMFYAYHFSEYNVPTTESVVRITFESDDLLLLSSITWLRAGDMNIDCDLLETNTYYKLKNTTYEYVLMSLNTAYPFLNLSESNPDCPRHILREFFKFGFKNYKSHGMIKKLEELKYDDQHRVFDFEFKNFYNCQRFIKRLSALGEWYGNPIVDYNAIKKIHKKFLEKQIYKNDKDIADNIILAVKNQIAIPIPKLTLMQESYINGILESIYGIEMPYYQPKYFSNSQDILTHLEECKIFI